MSLKSWIKTFYPVSALDATESDEMAVKHSVLKWRGVQPSHLKRHQVVYNYCRVVATKDILPIPNGRLMPRRGELLFKPNVDTFHFSSSTCALCQRYRDLPLHSPDTLPASRCFDRASRKFCPIVRLNGMTCDTSEHWIASRSGAQPMLDLLRKTLQFVTKGK